MKFDLVITRINNPHAANVVARRLAQDQNIPLHKALSLLENLPATYLQNIGAEEMVVQIAQLKKIGVAARALPVQPGPLPAQPSGTQSAEDMLPTQKVYTYSSISLPSKASKDQTSPRKEPALIATAVNIRQRRRQMVPAIFTVLVIIAIIIFVFVNRQQLDLGATGSVSKASSPANKAAAPAASGKVALQQRLTSNIFADSAHNAPTPDMSIKFYQMAISFNRRNVQAWYGLINAYRDAGKEDEAKATESEMKKIFGNDIIDFRHVIEAFGEIIDATATDGNGLQIEYITRMRGRDPILREVYAVMNGLHLLCNCATITVFAHTGEQAGLLASAQVKPFPQTYRDFAETATITFLK